MGVESRNIILLLDLFSKGRLAVQVIQPQYNRIITTTKSRKQTDERETEDLVKQGRILLIFMPYS